MSMLDVVYCVLSIRCISVDYYFLGETCVCVSACPHVHADSNSIVRLIFNQCCWTMRYVVSCGGTQNHLLVHVF